MAPVAYFSVMVLFLFSCQMTASQCPSNQEFDACVCSVLSNGLLLVSCNRVSIRVAVESIREVDVLVQNMEEL